MEESQHGSGRGFLRPSKWVLWFEISVCSPSYPFLLLLPIKLLVEQENEQVDVDGGLIEELHHRHAFILQLEEILRNTHPTVRSQLHQQFE